MNALIIFSLLIALMLTGMPISIALGLTVLTFLFVLTSVPIERLGPVAANFTTDRHAILDALEMLVHGL